MLDKFATHFQLRGLKKKKKFKLKVSCVLALIIDDNHSQGIDDNIMLSLHLIILHVYLDSLESSFWGYSCFLFYNAHLCVLQL